MNAVQGVSARIIEGLKSCEEYYPFGLAMKERSMSEDGYRFGFNGKENDRDFGNSQLIQDYGFRVYNPALGKFLSVDPLAPEYPWYTPYQFAGNKVIAAIDLDGLEEKWVINSVTLTRAYIKKMNREEFQQRESYQGDLTPNEREIFNRHIQTHRDNPDQEWKDVGDFEYINGISEPLNDGFTGGDEPRRWFRDGLSYKGREAIVHNRVVDTQDEDQKAERGVHVYGTFYIDEANHAAGLEVKHIYTYIGDKYYDPNGNLLELDDDTFNKLRLLNNPKDPGGNDMEIRKNKNYRIGKEGDPDLIKGNASERWNKYLQNPDTFFFFPHTGGAKFMDSIDIRIKKTGEIKKIPNPEKEGN